MSPSTRSVRPLRICYALPRSGWCQAYACLSTADARYELTDQLGNARVVFHRPTTIVTTTSAELGAEDSQWPGLAQARRYSAVAHQGVSSPSDYVASIRTQREILNKNKKYAQF
jgi:hypothetical protein